MRTSITIREASFDVFNQQDLSKIPEGRREPRVVRLNEQARDTYQTNTNPDLGAYDYSRDAATQYRDPITPEQGDNGYSIGETNDRSEAYSTSQTPEQSSDIYQGDSQDNARNDGHREMGKMRIDSGSARDTRIAPEQVQEQKPNYTSRKPSWYRDGLDKDKEPER